MKTMPVALAIVLFLGSNSPAQKRLTTIRATMFGNNNITSVGLSFYYREIGITKSLEMRDEKTGKPWFNCPSIIWRAIGRAALLCGKYDPSFGRQTIDTFPNQNRDKRYPTVAVQVSAPYNEPGVGFVLRDRAGDAKIIMQLTPEQAYTLSIVLASETGDLQEYTK